MQTDRAYLLLRSTYETPRDYGARVKYGRDDVTLTGKWTYETEVWSAIKEVVSLSLGDFEWTRFHSEYHEPVLAMSTKSRCVYSIDIDRAKVSMAWKVEFREPDSDPDRDYWKSYELEQKVVLDNEGEWLMIKIHGLIGYLIVHKSRATAAVGKMAAM